MPGKQTNEKHVVATKVTKPVRRTFQEEMTYITKISDCKYQVNLGFVPNMKVGCRPTVLYPLKGTNDHAEDLTSLCSY